MLGVILHAIGGFAAGSFYAPLKRVKGWAWESYWIVMGLAAWIITPWVVAIITTPNPMDTILGTDSKTLGLTFMFGVLWGIGGVTFGLTMRYLGIALGVAVALGCCAVFGTLMPPIVEGRLIELAQTPSGMTVFAGVFVCVLGIALCGWAGVIKERDLAEDSQTDAIPEFSLVKGFIVAVICGVLSACFAFGLAAAVPIAERSVEGGTDSLFANNAALCVILLGGFLTNFLWCIGLNIKNKTGGDYFQKLDLRQTINYGLCALGGFIWYNQFFFYGMGSTRMGKEFEFASWSLHMAFIIIFSNIWGLVLGEWKGCHKKTLYAVLLGLAVLIGSTIIIGYGNSLGGAPAGH